MNSAANPKLSTGEKIDFGVDAPGLVRIFFGGGIGVAAIAFAALMFLGGAVWALILKVMLVLVVAYLLGMGCLMLYWSWVAKIRRREEILDLVSWRGDEQVFDIGCGRGLMTIGAAKRLSTGRVVGIDIWDAKDQAGTSAVVTLDNARMAGVRDRVQIQTADARRLPFADSSFDVVTSHWVIHNIPDEAGRNQALAEIARVLRSGGRVLLTDIEFRDDYLKSLAALGLVDCRFVFNKVEDQILGAVSFGSFRPSTLIASKPS
jgi:arsenite methyltransferase